MAVTKTPVNTIHPITKTETGRVPVSLPYGTGTIVPNPVVRSGAGPRTLQTLQPMRTGGGTTGGGFATLKPVVPIMRSRGPVVPVVHENTVNQFNGNAGHDALGGDRAMNFEKFGS